MIGIICSEHCDEEYETEASLKRVLFSISDAWYNQEKEGCSIYALYLLALSQIKSKDSENSYSTVIAWEIIKKGMRDIFENKY